MAFFNIIIQILTLIGALVLFLYGMKVMSESLQKLAGRKMRNILAKITSRPSRGILTGFLITALIQSSSASTVLLVSFVNAGLISFTESIGIIFGANIGTTITAWLISLVGIGNNFGIYSVVLPLVALVLPLFFSYSLKNKARAEFVIGFAMLFVGILFFKENLPEINEDSALFKGLLLSDNPIINHLVFVGIGILITIIFQSSSATITFTMLLALEGWFPFSAALAMVVGENIGTTATAVFAGIVANRSARRTALAHLLFNLFGFVWVLPFIGVISVWVESFTAGINIDPVNQIPIGISIFHTSFNLVNTVLLTLLFVPFKKVCLAFLPNGNGNDEVFRLKYIDNSILSTSELSILQVRKEIAHMGKQVTLLFKMVPDLLLEKREKRFGKMLKQMQDGEELIDEMEVEITDYITKISKVELSDQGKQRIDAMLKIIDYLETIADVSYQMSLTIRKKHNAKAWFTQELRNNLSKEFGLIEKSLNLMVNNLQEDYLKVDLHDARRLEDEMLKVRGKLKHAYLNEVKREKLPYNTGVFYNDLLSLSEKIGNYAFLVNQAISIDEQMKPSKGNQRSQ